MSLPLNERTGDDVLTLPSYTDTYANGCGQLHIPDGQSKGHRSNVHQVTQAQKRREVVKAERNDVCSCSFERIECQIYARHIGRRQINHKCAVHVAVVVRRRTEIRQRARHSIQSQRARTTSWSTHTRNKHNIENSSVMQKNSWQRTHFVARSHMRQPSYSDHL